ncbi:phage protein NinX family protein [Cronobacter dublinensis]|uniref:phage protein NinX family protein n=1 Tax=Cronobacter dublinensis TaxID=413497 RepID=UPI000CFD967A|nr:phage protein NinX family protein [Cronobacter dublinensis]
MDYSQLEDTEITIRVGETFGWNPFFINGDGSVVFRDDRGRLKGRKDYCNNPADAWPIIVENNISISNGGAERWTANDVGIDNLYKDKNPLRAAMVVFLLTHGARHA